MIQATEVAQANAFIDIQRYQRAIDILLPHLARIPDDHRAQCLLAQSYLGLNDGSQALRAAEDAVRTEPDHEWALRLLSSALLLRRRYDEARAAADRAVAAAPTEWRTHVQQANAGLAQDTLVGAISGRTWEAAYRAVELAPQEAATHQTIGRVALAAKMPKLAEQQFREALRIDPENAVSQNNLAVALMRRRRLGSAMRLFLGAARLDPTDPTFGNNLRLVLRTSLGYLTLIGFLTSVICLIGASGSPSQTTYDYAPVTAIPSFVISTDASGNLELPSGFASAFAPKVIGSHYTPATPGSRGHFTLLTVLTLINVGLAVALFWRLRRSVGRGLVRLLTGSMRRDARLTTLLTLPSLGVVSFAIAGVLGYPQGRGWTIVAMVSYLAGAILGGGRVARAIWRRRDAARA
jgi:Flp pilus assembly protein TadD